MAGKFGVDFFLPLFWKINLDFHSKGDGNSHGKFALNQLTIDLYS